MTRFLLPVFFVIAAVALFFGYIDPVYDDVLALREEEKRFDEALVRTRELQEVKERLLSKYNSIPQKDLERLEKMLPDKIDNVRLVLNMDDIASQHGLQVRNIKLESVEGSSDQASTEQSESEKPHRSAELSFEVTASYEDFLSFLQDLETSLRLIDVSAISFGSENASDLPGAGDSFDYSVRIKAYWLN